MSDRDPSVGDEAEAFAHGHEWGVDLATVLSDTLTGWIEADLTPALARVVAAGDDTAPVLRGVAEVLRSVADGIDPDPA